MGSAPQGETQGEAQAQGGAQEQAEPQAQGEPQAAVLAQAEEDPARSLRRGALWAGVPLALALLVPYRFDDALWAAWEVAESFDARGLVVAPVAGVVMVLAALVPRIPHGLRVALVAAAGVVAALSLRELALHPEVLGGLSRGVRRMSLSAVEGLVGAILLACALEVAMQRRRGSRLWAALALVGWLHLLARWLVPLSEGRIETTPFIGMTEAVTELHREPAALLLIAPALMYLFLPALQALLAFIRLVTGADRRAQRPWRSSWSAVVLAILPGAAVGLTLCLLALLEEEWGILLVAVNGGALLFGSLLGVVWGMGHLLPVLGESLGRLRRGLRSERAESRRGARLVTGLLILLAVGWVGHRVWRATRPDPRDAALVSLVGVTQEAILDATMDRPYDPRWHGGYSELDIRASSGALREVLGEGATVEPVLFAFELVGHAGLPFSGRAVVIDDRVRWARLSRGWSGGELSALEETVPALAGAVERASRALGGGECVEPLRPEDLRGLPERAQELLPPEGTVERACQELPASERRLDDAGHRTRGAVGDYLMLVRSGDRWLALRGSWHADGGRLWLGRVEVTEP